VQGQEETQVRGVFQEDSEEVQVSGVLYLFSVRECRARKKLM